MGRGVDGFDLAVRYHLDAAQGACTQERVHYVPGHVRLREGAVSALHYAAEAVFLEKGYKGFRGKVVPGGAYKIHIRPDMVAEGGPVFYIGEIAAALAGNHDLAARLGHFFQYGYSAPFCAFCQHFCCTYGCHQPGGSSANNNNIRTHTY